MTKATIWIGSACLIFAVVFGVIALRNSCGLSRSKGSALVRNQENQPPVARIIRENGLGADELRIICKPTEYATGTMRYQESVTYELGGYEPLVIRADMATGVYPTGASRILKLGPARFLLLGGHSTGGGTYTKGATILIGQRGRLLIQDQMTFTRDRGLHDDEILAIGGEYALGFPPIPPERDDVSYVVTIQVVKKD